MLTEIHKDKRKTVGIIGGMGPAATALLFQKMIAYTDAAKDSEHIHIIIDNCTSIPDRTAAILKGDDTPAKAICEIGRKLEAYGAELLAIPCNTSHYYYSYIQQQLNVPVMNMIEETAKECILQGYHKVGVLATTGTCQTGTYDKELNKHGIEVFYPDEEGQIRLMEIIYDQIKAGKEINTGIFESYLREMKQRGAEAFILGCTELPMAFSQGDYGCCFIDSLDILAKRTVEKAGFQIKIVGDK